MVIEGKYDQTIGIAMALLIHSLLLYASGLVLVKPVEFAVESADSAMEVDLAAVPFVEEEQRVPTPQESTVPLPEPLPELAATEPEDPLNIVQASEKIEIKQEPVTMPPVKPVVKEVPKVQESKPVVIMKTEPPLQENRKELAKKEPPSDNLNSRSGVRTVYKPDYLKNPAPIYPKESRRLGQEGLVLVEVHVDRFGRPEEVQLMKTSGYGLLDKAALEAVKTWHFRPAKIGELAVESRVEVPIRFELKER